MLMLNYTLTLVLLLLVYYRMHLHLIFCFTIVTGKSPETVPKDEFSQELKLGKSPNFSGRWRLKVSELVLMDRNLEMFIISGFGFPQGSSLL